jgi:hypothetical protein
LIMISRLPIRKKYHFRAIRNARMLKWPWYEQYQVEAVWCQLVDITEAKWRSTHDPTKKMLELSLDNDMIYQVILEYDLSTQMVTVKGTHGQVFKKEMIRSITDMMKNDVIRGGPSNIITEARQQSRFVQRQQAESDIFPFSGGILRGFLTSFM